MKRVVVGVTAAIALAAAATWGLWSTNQAPTPHGDLAPRGNVVPVVSGSVVTYLIAPTEGPVVLVNSGDDPTAAAILAELKSMGRSPRDVAAVLLTHGSYDHCAGLEHFPAARVYASSDDLDLIDHVRRIRSSVPRIRMRLFGRPERPRRTRTVLPGEVLRIGPTELECIGLPGVTEGSVAYRWESMIFVGDSFWPGPALPSPFWLEDEDALRATLPRLDRYDASWLATSRQGFIEKPEKVLR